MAVGGASGQLLLFLKEEPPTNVALGGVPTGNPKPKANSQSLGTTANGVTSLFFAPPGRSIFGALAIPIA
jgi:hypothetical protein